MAWLYSSWSWKCGTEASHSLLERKLRTGENIEGIFEQLFINFIHSEVERTFILAKCYVLVDFTNSIQVRYVFFCIRLTNLPLYNIYSSNQADQEGKHTKHITQPTFMTQRCVRQVSRAPPLTSSFLSGWKLQCSRGRRDKMNTRMIKLQKLELHISYLFNCTREATVKIWVESFNSKAPLKRVWSLYTSKNKV